MNQSGQSTQPGNFALSPIETLTPGVSLQRVINTNLFLFTILELNRTNVDAWIDRIIAETEKQTDHHIPTFWLHDASACKTVSLSPYLRHRVMDMVRRFPDRVGYNAVIMPKTFVVQIVVLFIRNMPTRSKNQLFFSREEGVRWLREMGAPYQKATPEPERV